MQHVSKISKVPRDLRDEFNRRLEDGEENKKLLAWLNDQPEVQTMLKQDFDGLPITKQNLNKWKKSGFRNWQLRQAALDFTNDVLPDDDLDSDALEKMSAKLIRFLQLRYAAVAGSLPAPDEDPEVELRRLSDLCNNLTSMRRGDLSAERLAIEQQRLALEKSRAEKEMENIFWEWTKRPDVQAQLYPHRDPEQHKREVDRMLTHKLLGIAPRDTNGDSAPAEDPAILI
jgi:hypothetical protein